MKTAIVFKWSRDPQDARVSLDGEVVWGNAKPCASDDDFAAMKAAKSVAGDDEVIGVTTGEGKVDWAAARGACRTLVLENASDDFRASALARQVAAAVKTLEGVEFVAVGDSDWSPAFVSALAGALGWNAFAGVATCEPCEGGVRIACKEAGSMRVVEAPLPVLVAVKAASKESNPPGMKQALAARKKPVDKIDAETLLPASEGELFPIRTVLPESDGALMLETDDLEAACAKLAGELRAKGVLQ